VFLLFEVRKNIGKLACAFVQHFGKNTMDTALELELENDIALMEQEENISEYELERGKPMPKTKHGSVQANLLIALSKYYKKQFRLISELTIEVGDRTAVPDISIYRRFEIQWDEDEPAAKVEPPLVAIEIISPSQTFGEMREKARQYFAQGVQSCWIVQPELRIVSVLHPQTPPQTFTSDMVQDSVVGIEIPIEEVFE
jgi:Uma2 family endonuclease